LRAALVVFDDDERVFGSKGRAEPARERVV
jgi:hypothetical protein